MDCIDIHVGVMRVSYNELSTERISENSERVRERVIKARLVQEKRYVNNDGVHRNAQVSSKQLRVVCKIDEAGNQLLKTAMERLGLSAEPMTAF